MSTAAIETARIEDVEALFTLINEAYEIEVGSTGLAFKTCGRYLSVEQLEAELNEALSKSTHRFYVAVAHATGSDNRRILVGCLRAHLASVGDHRVCEFGPFAVAPNCQGSGIGSALMHELDRFAKSEGVDLIRCEVVNHRTDALSYYTKRGFQVVGQEEFVANCDLNMLTRPCHFIVLEKNIAQTL